MTKGSPPVLPPAEGGSSFYCIDTGSLAGLRDQAFLSVMLYSFAWVSAVLGIGGGRTYVQQESREVLRLH